MINKETLKKQIIYRSTHRGSKELDIILGNFVKKYVQTFSENELKELQELLLIEDEILYNLYFNKIESKVVSKNKVSGLFKKYKI